MKSSQKIGSGVRIQQVWELEPRPGDFRIPAPPADIVPLPVLPTQRWAEQDLTGFASFTVQL